MTVAGQKVRLTQQTEYPWKETVKIAVALANPASFALRVRVPGWARNQPVPSNLYRYLDAPEAGDRPTIKVNGRSVPLNLDKGFAVVQRQWRKGDTVELTLPMHPRRVLSHEAVKDNAGRVAIERGPVVYCAEGVDNQGRALNVVMDDAAKFTTQHQPGLLNGVTVVKAGAKVAVRDAAGNPAVKNSEITLVPYYAWCHRGVGEMSVWLPRTPDKAQLPPPPTLAGESKITASHVWSMDTLSAVNDGEEPKNSMDHDVPRLTFWDHRGTTEWVQYDFKAPATVSAVEVYWFDDTGRGGCRVPASWSLQYHDGSQWKPVTGVTEYGVKRDTYNRVAFTPVTTPALRLEVKLQPGFSGGILEGKVVGK
jgi:hypothetical protein